MPSQFKNETANYSDFVNANKVLRKIKENPMTMNSLSLGNLQNAVLDC